MERPLYALCLYALCVVSVKGGSYADLSKEILNDMSRECVRSVSEWAPKVLINHHDISLPIEAPIKKPMMAILQNPKIIYRKPVQTTEESTDYTHEQANMHNYSEDESPDYDLEGQNNENLQFTEESHPGLRGRYPTNIPIRPPKVNFPQMPRNPYQERPHPQPDYQEENGDYDQGQYNEDEDVSNQQSVQSRPMKPNESPNMPHKAPTKSQPTRGQSQAGDKGPWKEDNPNDMMAAFKRSGKESMEIAWGAIVSEEVTKRVAKRYHLNKEQIAKELPSFDISDTGIDENCNSPPENNFETLDQVAESQLPAPKCAFDRYRSQNGFCNNLLFPRRGNSMVKFNRGLPPDYSDGISSPRVGKSGRPLPSPRLVSNFIVRDGNRPDRQISHLVMQWGQFIDHDISHTTEWKGNDSNTLDCCDPKNQNHPQCFPIPIPHDDPFYSHFGNSCMPLTRSLPAPRPGCTLGPREQLNQITSFIDASQIYGSSDEKAQSLREMVSGRLRVMALAGPGKEVLPNEGGDPRRCPLEKMHQRSGQCSFEAGDARSNLKVSLTTLHIIWLREHNRIAGILEHINPQWDDETIYQETRRIVGSMMQQIIYGEYLPWLLGDTWKQWDIVLLEEGFYDRYDIFTNPAVFNEFATAAYRYGHSLVNAKLERYDVMNKKIPANDTWVSDHIFKPFDLYKPGRIDEYLRGLLIENAQTFDNLITSQLTNWLFKPHENAPGLDLASINIQRGRDHGLPGYNYWRSLCGLKPARTFEELDQYFIPGQAEQFSNIYEHPDDIDLFPAGISEIPVKNGIIGPVFACIIGKQFEVLRKGDRFWFENYINPQLGLSHGFTPDQINEIRKVKLSRVICENSDTIQIVQVQALLTPHPKMNPIVQCDDLNVMDLNKWKNADRVPVLKGRPPSLAELIAEISPSSRSSGPSQVSGQYHS